MGDGGEVDIERMRVRGICLGWDAVAEHSTVGAHVRDRGFVPLPHSFGTLVHQLVCAIGTYKLQYSRRKQATEETG